MILLVSIPSESFAEESSYMPDSPLVYAIAGLFIVDVGVSLSNGFSLINDSPNKINGYFGVVTGVISLGLVAINYVAEDNTEMRNDFALAMGTAGATSLILGAINVRESGNTNNISLDDSKIQIYPTYIWEKDQEHKIGININILF